MERNNTLTLTSLTPEIIKQALEKTKTDADFSDGELILITTEYYDKAFSMLKESYIHDEPIGKSVGLEWTPEFEKKITSEFNQNLSIMFVHKATGEAMGIHVICIRTDKEEGEWINVSTEANKQVLGIINCLNRKAQFHKRYDCEDCILFVRLVVSRKYRRHGLGTKLFNAALAFSKNLGIAPFCIKVVCSSNYSQQICERAGFDTLAIMPYNDYKEDGNIVFKETGEHTSLACYGYLVKSTTNIM